MKSVKPWKVTVNGEGFWVEAIKSTTAIDYGMEKYLMGKRTSLTKPLNSHFLDHATITIEPYKEENENGTQSKLLESKTQ